MSSGEDDSVVAMIIDGGGGGGGGGGGDGRPEKSDGGGEESSRKRTAFTVSNAEGLNCSICIEPWESQGAHQICCLPCGHVYGVSCISKWIRQNGGDSAKCPQCNVNCRLKDVIKLYASPVVVLDEILQKKVKLLEAEVNYLKTERAGLINMQENLFNVQEDLFKELQKLKENPRCGNNAPSGKTGMDPLNPMTSKDKQGHGEQWDCYFAPNYGGPGTRHCVFQLENEMAVEGARLFDMDASYQILVLARRLSGLGGTHILQKINLIYPLESEDIQLPPSTKAIKDVRVSPCGRLTLLASLGKKLSILSMGSNNLVINYNLPGQAWSCSWDLSSSNYIYAGLQNGTLLVFDMRSSLNPLQTLVGLTSRPIHTIHSLLENRVHSHTAQKVLTASSSGPCIWNINSPGERPFLVPGLEDQGVCTSLAYSPSSDDIVASFRPTRQTSNGNVGSHVRIKRMDGSSYHNITSVSSQSGDFQLTRSAIVDVPNCFPVFGHGDGPSRGLGLLELPDLTASHTLEPFHQHSVLDVKYAAHSQGKGLLGCISENKLQLFSVGV